MIESENLEAIIAELSEDLRPVRPMRPPLIRAASWIGTVLIAAGVLACFADDRGLGSRLGATPDMWLAVLGSAITAASGAIAAFELSVPDRNPRWAALPIPGLALWVGASGFGCLRTWFVPDTHDASLAESGHCLTFIVLISVPLSGLTFIMLRRAFPLRPNLTALVAGLGIAGAAATLLNFFHPYDATASDLAVHAVAVLVVIGANQVSARFLPSRSKRRWSSHAGRERTGASAHSR